MVSRDPLDRQDAAGGKPTASAVAPAGDGLVIDQVFSTPGVHPFEQIQWDRRSARINDGAGRVVFEQDDVEVPSTWSQLAANVVVSKYFYGEKGTGERENSVKQLVHRVCRTNAD